ncbi:hypothetical protein [Chitinophaga nivalis]|uniref:Thymidylate kinase n=1 Tax=Chitinophaga nivalis TaxID=2991709 RepID=A0ABT3IT14_9BACT|nr:hypothetical protein [Chitinophaga nivalis]MCW3463445.1 hypothetical protein [Chitinophaga nivalis]MCW3486865.1 hypothetical protein [Chitinophaga nivalis]
MRNPQQSLILAIDGHDGAGKTTLAGLLAEKLGGVYVRPFGGATGTSLITQAEQHHYQEVSRIGLMAIRDAAAQHDARVLVFDRHWMTVFTLIPAAYRDEWFPLPATTLCYAGMPATLLRLGERDEAIFDRAYHEGYMQQYYDLAHQYGAHILRTDQHDVAQCLDMLVQWATNL